jgi:hypothetical protein
MLPTHFNRCGQNFQLHISTMMLTSLLKSFLYPDSAGAQINSIRLFSSKFAVLSPWSKERYYSDLEYRRQILDKRVTARRLRKARDPEYHERMKAQYAKDFQRLRSCKRSYKFKMFVDWLRYGWHEADLPWKTYRPEVSSEGVRHRCSGCNLPDHKTKFWWSSMSESETYLCGRCTWKLSWEELCPKSFESADTRRDFTACAKELGVSKPSGSVP